MAEHDKTFVRWGRSGKEVHWGRIGSAFTACRPHTNLSIRSQLSKAYGATAVTCERCQAALAQKGN